MLLRNRRTPDVHDLGKSGQNFRNRAPRWLTIGVALFCAASFFASSAFAGPVENGLAELNAALTARKLKWRIKTEFSQDPPESFRIEPYSSGGAYVTGGDVRGLMYGLLEAAEQIRENGRFIKMHVDRAAALRGVRLELDSGREYASEDFWRSYFQMLAHNRFNRAHVVFGSLVRPYRSVCLISKAAADYSVDFTLGVGGSITAGEMGVLLTLCPAVRSVAVEPASSSRMAVLEAAQHAGRFVTVDTDGSASAISSAGVALLRPSDLWPPSFEIRPTYHHSDMARNLGAAAQSADPPLSVGHESFYWVWGRYGYDPKATPPKDANAAEYEAARMATLQIAAAGLADEGGSDHVASATEAVRNLKQGIASAKFTPLDIAAALETAAALLEKSATSDFQVIASLAKDRAREERAAYAKALRAAEPPSGPGSTDAPGHIDHGVDHSADHGNPERGATDHAGDRANVFYANATTSEVTLTRPQIFHKPYQNTAADQAMPVTLKVTMPRPAARPSAKSASKLTASAESAAGTIKLVRLHYRTLDPQAKETVLEEPAAPEVHFTIPGSDLTGSWDLFYYFEILNAEGSGWFEPDPLTAATPYFTVHIQAPRTGPN